MTDEQKEQQPTASEAERVPKLRLDKDTLQQLDVTDAEMERLKAGGNTYYCGGVTSGPVA